MAIHHWPAGERPREKLLEQGAEYLSDAELLALFLGSGTAGKSAVDVARELLVEYEGLRGLLTADAQRVQRSRGLGPARYALLQAALELSRRHWAATLERGPALQNPADTRKYLAAHLRDQPYEVFACLFLDNRHRVIRYEELFRGTINGASVHPREVARRALELNAAAVIAAHNHPSGIAEPSSTDRALTETLKNALALLDVRLLDHIVVGDGTTVSLAERGWM